MKLDSSKGIPVRVYLEKYEVDEEISAHYEGLYMADIDTHTTIAFIPAFTRTAENWPPTLPANIDNVQNSEEARRWTAALAACVVTPDPLRAGQQETIFATRDLDGKVRPTLIFYITPAQFETFSAELEQVAERTYGVHNYVYLHQLNEMSWVQFITTHLPEK